MPELPEVQALATFVASRSRARRVVRVDLLSFAALKTVSPPPSALVGRDIAGCGRRGKFLLIETVPGGPVPPEGDPLWLVVHFARAGWLRWHDAPADAGGGARSPATAEGLGAARSPATAEDLAPGLRAVPPGDATRSRIRGGPLALRVTLDDGSGFDLTEAGTQKRLAVYVVRSPADIDGIARLGIDPLDPAFDSGALGELLARRSGQLKHLLADQSVIAGVGNAYSDEALHAARLSPFRPAGNLSAEEVERLHDALLAVLREALARNEGVPASGLKDEKRTAMRVHGRTGLPCPVCGDTIREVSFADRSLQYCATCQTGGKPLADRRLSRLLR